MKQHSEIDLIRSKLNDKLMYIDSMTTQMRNDSQVFSDLLDELNIKGSTQLSLKLLKAMSEVSL